MSNEFASKDLTVGQINAIVKKLGGHERALRFLRGELTVSEPIRAWHEEDGVITFTLTSDGTTGPEWIARLEKAGYRLSRYAKDLLVSSEFMPTEKGTVHDVRVLKGMLFNDSDRITKNIRADAERRGFTTPHPEAACLIREKFSDKDLEEMGLLWIVTMHEPIDDSDGDPSLLSATRNGVGCWLDASYDFPGFRWYRERGFAFVAVQVRA